MLAIKASNLRPLRSPLAAVFVPVSVKRVSYGFRNIEVYVRKIVLSFIPIAFLPISSHFLL